MCGCGCGQPATEAYDKTSIYKVHKFTCQAGRAKAKVAQQDAENARKANKPDGWNDGLHYYVERVDPEEGD